MFNGGKQQNKKIEGCTIYKGKEEQRTPGMTCTQTGELGNISPSASEGPKWHQQSLGTAETSTASDLLHSS